MRITAETARVLITVKATPQPSEKYRDTVCVAGIRLDGPEPSWIRLYPIAFQYLGEDAQFLKYDVVELSIRRRDLDTRAENYSPDERDCNKIGHISVWRERHGILQNMVSTTTCAVNRAAAADHRATSLGIVFSREVTRLKFEPYPPWTADELRKMRQQISRESEASDNRRTHPCGHPHSHSIQGSIRVLLRKSVHMYESG